MLSIKNQIEYWQDGAAESYKTMVALERSGRYSDSLFFGHLILEKILKAFVVLETKSEAPKIHNLIRLHELGDVGLREDDLEYIATINDFNIRGRYDDYKKAFYKTCTKEFTARNSAKIIEIYKMLCQKLEQKKS